MESSKVVHVHFKVPYEGMTDLYFGSLKAIYAQVPEDIIADMRAGLNRDELERTECITDRREAIRQAVKRAKPGTVVLVAGKGHETYQEVNGIRHHFDDREEVKSALEERI